VPGLIDWSTALKVDPDLPSRLNRAFSSTEKLLRDLRAFQASTEEALVDLELPDVGPGAGTYGGSGDFVESLTFDDQGRVTAVVVDAPPAGSVATRDGSIFSMVGPGGGAAPVVAYDFTLFNSALTLAQNLTNANQSGNSDYNLVAAGTPIYTYSARSGSATQATRATQPFSGRTDGGGLFTSSDVNYAETAIHPAGLLLQAAMSFEWMGYFPIAPLASKRLITFAGSGGTATDNWQYTLTWNSSTKIWTYYHETGTHTGNSTGLITTSDADMTQPDQVRLFALTRSAAGLVTLYMDGRKVADAVTASPNALPTGGSTAKLRIGYLDTGSSDMITIGARIFNYALTAAQVQASYHRTFFGVSV
jgi:hypothetical protein